MFTSKEINCYTEVCSLRLTVNSLQTFRHRKTKQKLFNAIKRKIQSATVLIEIFENVSWKSSNEFSNSCSLQSSSMKISCSSFAISSSGCVKFLRNLNLNFLCKEKFHLSRCQSPIHPPTSNQYEVRGRQNYAISGISTNCHQSWDHNWMKTKKFSSSQSTSIDNVDWKCKLAL